MILWFNCRRIIALSFLPSFSAFSSKGNININIATRLTRRGSIQKMSTSSTPLPQPVEEVNPTDLDLNKKKDSDDMDMLEKWINHDHHSYHLDFLSPTQAYDIRSALVLWYRANRRKLPWRGDAGPYDGSTVGYAATASSNGKKAANDSKKRKDEGNDIRSFFAASASSKKKKTNTVEGELKASALGASSSTQSSGDDEQQQQHEKAREVTAYGVWVSEIMLQQTRVEAVIPYWLKWMNSFPTVYDLASATDEEVNSHWAGLGFYRRARLLHAGAKRVVEEYNGVVPNTVEELMKVEGIGRYTASAVCSIAYGVEVPVVDGNVCRVLSRLAGIANHIKAPVMKDDIGWTMADRIIQAKPSSDKKKESKQAIGIPGEINQALMELGATYCSPAGSGIDENDPLKDFYVSTKLGVAIGNTSRTRCHVESLIVKASSEEGNKCKLCDGNGISTAYYNIMDRVTEDLSKDAKTKPEQIYAIAGHASLPIPPPKKSKREEVIAVAVISSKLSNNQRCWLMIKRPKDGLLSGQWEFPSVCVWNSVEEAKKDKGKTKDKGKKKAAGKQTVPVIDPSERSGALDSFLSDIFQADDDMQSIEFSKRAQLKTDPIVHIFSHVCHTMYIEHADIDEKVTTKRWKLSEREIGWFTEDDMAKVGITSAIRKILATTQRQT